MKKMSKIKVALDAGHGCNTPGKRTPFIKELGRQIHEYEFNSEVTRKLALELERTEKISPVLIALDGTDWPLSERVRVANEAQCKLFISNHFNAFDGEFDNNDPSGITIYYNSAIGKQFAGCVHKYLVQGTAQKDRGLRYGNYTVIAKTVMPAILVENGFMDNKQEAMLMLDDSFTTEVAIEQAKGICEYLGVKYIPKKEEAFQNKIYYRVQAGAFKSKSLANAFLSKLKKEGFVSAFILHTDGYYKVQLASFSYYENAVRYKDSLSKKYKTFISKVLL